MLRPARLARLVGIAIASGLGIAMIWANATSWGLEDWRTYLVAAQRVADGGPVYDWSAGPEFVYRYAPWFAYALLPFLSIPSAAADALWSTLVVAGVIGSIAPLLLQRSLVTTATALLMAGLLVRVASTGNVHPLLMAGLVLGLHTRAGPVVVALAASLKAVPILFAAVYVAERRWLALAMTLVLTAILAAPMLWLGYEPAPGPSESLFDVSPLAWGITASIAVAAVAVLAIRGSRHTTLAAGTAAFLALPRSFLYDLSMLLPAAGPSRRSDQAERNP